MGNTISTHGIKVGDILFAVHADGELSALVVSKIDGNVLVCHTAYDTNPLKIMVGGNGELSFTEKAFQKDKVFRSKPTAKSYGIATALEIIQHELNIISLLNK